MYGLVLAAAMTAGASSPELHFRHHSCCGYSSCHGCCGYSSYHGCCGYSSCHGCCGYSIASYHGCCGCYGCYGCCGYSGCCGYMGCCGYSGCGGYVAVVPSCSGCYGFGGYAMTYPSAPAPHVMPGTPVMPGAPAMAPATVVLKTGKDVTVTVDGKPTTLTAAETTFSTPALDPSKTYTYVFEAKQAVGGETKTEKKTVTVVAGKETVVDFTKLDADEAKSVETAKVTVILPGEGKVFVNEVEIAIKGKQTFETPKLTPGKRYFYTVKADLVKDGKTSSETRKVTIEAGKSVTVDFTPSDVLTASR
jgi:uncharacterized protein (TIGR03000 family)